MITVGTKLGRYEIRSQLGAGGMGEVVIGPSRIAVSLTRDRHITAL